MIGAKGLPTVSLGDPRSMEQVRELLKTRPRQLALLVLRDGQQIFVPVKLG